MFPRRGFAGRALVTLVHTAHMGAGNERYRRLGGIVALLGAAGSGLMGCSHHTHPVATAATMSVVPQTALLDEAVAVSLHGLPAGARITVTAKATDADGTSWASSAQFTASPAGAVSLSQASVGGSYSGVNPMGLFVFMAPASAGSAATTFLSPASGYDVSLRATVDGRVAGTAIAHRRSAPSLGLIKKDLRPSTSGIYGELYLPAKPIRARPAVLIFGGSDGGLSTFAATLLAAHGYPVLALAYFKEPGLPQTLANIPLEYFAKALTVLRAQPGVDPHHVLVKGVSRGGEVALLLGATYPQLINGVVANVPSSLVNTGYPDASKPAWTLHGQPLPNVGPNGFGNASPAQHPQAVIAVEKIRGPVLLTCGAEDLIWPSCRYVDAITTRLHAQHFAYPVTALHYADAGHVDAISYYSATLAAFARFGGTLSGDQAAQIDGHRQLLAFLTAQD